MNAPEYYLGKLCLFSWAILLSFLAKITACYIYATILKVMLFEVHTS